MTGKVLIVDDEEDVRRYLSAALEDEGLEPLLARNAKEGRSFLETEEPDLLLLDLVLPGQTGMAFYREMRQSSASRFIPVIVVTGINSADAKERLGLGATMPPPDAYLEKPLDLPRLLAKVRELLGGGAGT